MKISYNWLKEYVEITETPEELGKILTGTGLEVELVEPTESVVGGLKGLVIGEVLTCAKHPNADKLSITTVDIGTGTPLHIVCGAPNVTAGQKVIVAPPGVTIYPTAGEPFTIKKAKIRGKVSEGMICAEDEIGLGAGHDGIIVLDAGAPVGQLASSYYNIESDFVFEIGLTPNRADAASHMGTARDIRAFKRLPLKLPPVDSFAVDNTNLTIPVVVENAEACPRYSAITISGLSVMESPDWLKNRLKAIGLSPINNIVDVTNYVCHELGQPLHAFDASKIEGQQVIVKTLPEGTRFKTLDGKERLLTANDLMICSKTEGMCIAGVFGGIHSGITSDTKEIFLESAYFSSGYVRKTGMHHQLKTDASFRFERGTDPNITVYALKRAALLIKSLAGGEISSEIIDIYPQPVENRNIKVKYTNVDRLIGKSIPRDIMFSILSHLDIEIREQHDDHCIVSVPPYRVDVTQEADVVEEVLRIYGFNNIPLTAAAGTSYLAEFPEKDPAHFRRGIGEILAANGFYETLTNSLTQQAYYTKTKLGFDSEAVEVLNKLSEELGMLRQSMLFSALEVCAHNINRKQKDLKLFEFGKTYGRKNGRFEEREHLTLIVTGNMETENWQNKPRAVGYYDIMQYVSILLQKCNLNQLTLMPAKNQILDFGMRLMDGPVEYGHVGKVKSSLAKEFGLKQEIFYADLDATLLFNAANPKLVIEPVPRYPEVRRDLSLVLDKKVTFDEIKQLAESIEKRLIRDILAFDVYEGKNLPDGKKAYALGFILQDPAKTLTDEEIDGTMNKLMGAFEKKMGALIRK